MVQPLENILVLDFSTLLPGPMATLMLAEAGAEDHGDLGRLALARRHRLDGGGEAGGEGGDGRGHAIEALMAGTRARTSSRVCAMSKTTSSRSRTRHSPSTKTWRTSARPAE